MFMHPLSETVSLPMWAAAAAAVAIVVATVLVRRLTTQRQIAALFGIALLAVASIVGPPLLRAVTSASERHGVVVADHAGAERRALEQRRAVLSARATMPGSPLACLGALASKPVEAACERSVFASPTSVAVAVSFAATQLQLLADGVAFARRSDPGYAASLSDLRLAAENDAYGIYAHVLATRDGCTPTRCDAFSLLHDPSTLKAHLRERHYASAIAQHRDRWRSRAVLLAVAPETTAPEPPASRPTGVTTALAPPISLAAAATAIPLPRARPVVTAQSHPPAAAPTMAAAGPPPDNATAGVATQPAPPLWLSSAAAPIRPSEAERTVTVTVQPSATAPAPVEAVTPAGKPPVPEDQRLAIAPVPVDDPTVTAHARQARSRGVVPPAASVLRNLEYPSASSIPPISIMAAEPERPAEAVPSTAPVPPSRPR